MSAPNSALNYQLLRLGALLQLEQRARAAGRKELEFLMVNDTATVVSYQQAALWRRAPDGPGTLVLSGVAVAETGAPYRMWLDRAVAAIVQGAEATNLHALVAGDLPEALAAEWPEWFPPNALWCPLARREGELIGGLLFGRTDPWLDGDRQMIEMLSGAYAQSLILSDAVKPAGFRSRWATLRRRPVIIGIAAALVLAALAPTRQSVLAPAEIVPVDPAPVRAPFEGVVDALRVAPNEPVHAGQPVVSLDRTQLATRYAVTQKALDMAKEEYADTAQAAMSDEKSKGKLAILASKVDQQQAELAYDKDQLDRAEVTAPADGIAVFDDSNEWAGKPVALGERIMQIASPTNTQLEMQVPAAEVVTFDLGSEVVFFSNLAPDSPSRGSLAFASYSSAVTADGVLSYAFRAKLDPKDAGLRLGLKGTAKIYGPRRPLALWLLRRPIQLVREWLSL
jgi:multidrug resistance efflux pump